MSASRSIATQPHHPRIPLAKHQEQLGHDVTLTTTSRTGRRKTIEGEIVDIRHTEGTVVDVETGEQWYTIAIDIKTKNGRVVTTTFADR